MSKIRSKKHSHLVAVYRQLLKFETLLLDNLEHNAIAKAAEQFPQIDLRWGTCDVVNKFAWLVDSSSKRVRTNTRRVLADLINVTSEQMPYYTGSLCFPIPESRKASNNTGQHAYATRAHSPNLMWIEGEYASMRRELLAAVIANLKKHLFP